MTHPQLLAVLEFQRAMQASAARVNEFMAAEFMDDEMSELMEIIIRALGVDEDAVDDFELNDEVAGDEERALPEHARLLLSKYCSDAAMRPAWTRLAVTC